MLEVLDRLDREDPAALIDRSRRGARTGQQALYGGDIGRMVPAAQTHRSHELLHDRCSVLAPPTFERHCLMVKL